tara:strand:- start:1340 stop:2572 length:1233 start_codon:yes stop_codon:yes gene_type:complete
MDNSVFDLNQPFDFNILNLGNPTLANNNNYISKINHGTTNKNLYIQLPKCKCKNGIIKSSSKTYTELNLCISHKNVIDFFENLEKICADKIYNNKESWFYGSSEIDRNDIDELMLSTMKPYKHGKNFLIKANIKLDKLHIYDENENKIPFDDFDNACEFIPLININNIKFTSKNFSIEIILTQIMIILPSDEFEKRVLIKTDKSKLLDNSINNNHILNSPNKIIDNEKSNELLTLPINTENTKNIENIENTENIENIENIETIEKTENTKNIENNENINIESYLEKSKPESNILDENLNKLDINSTLVKEINTSNNSNTNEFKYLFNDDNLETVDILNISDSESKENTINLKSHDQIYLEIYKTAKQKAKEIKKNAIAAFLEAKKIKNKYNLDNLDSDSSDDEDFLNFNN